VLTSHLLILTITWCLPNSPESTPTPSVSAPDWLPCLCLRRSSLSFHPWNSELIFSGNWGKSWLRRLWSDLLLYAEHTYTSSGGYSRPESEQSVRQIESKHFHVADAREAAHWMAQESMSRLLDSIGIAAPAMVVFNSLGHERSGLVEVDLSNGAQLVDTESGQPAALESLRSGNGYRRVRFLAVGVPSMGYRVYRIESSRTAPASAEPKPANSIENEFYRVTVDPNRGGVSSVFDKQAGRELVDPKSPYLLDQYLYVSGGENTASSTSPSTCQLRI